MIVAVYPMFSRIALNADSTYVCIDRLIRATAALRDDVFFDVIWPSNTKDFFYYRDGLFDLPNVRRVPLRFHPAKIKQVASFCAFEHGAIFDYKEPVDVVLNYAPEVGDLIRHQIATYNPSGKPAVVNVHQYVVHDSLPYPVELDQSHILLRQLVGSFNIDANVFDSKHCRAMFTDNLTRYVSPYVRDKILATCVDIAHGPLVADELDRARADAASLPIDHAVPRIAYNHRLQHYKNYKTTFDLLATLHNEGVRFRVIVFGSPDDAAQMSWVGKFPFVDIYLSQTRREYLAMLATCDVNVTNSQHETFCISAVESMALGHALVGPRAVTFPEITGADTGLDIQTLFTSPVEQADVLRRVLRDPSFRDAQSRLTRAHVWQSYTADVHMRAMLALFDRLATRHDVRAVVKHRAHLEGLITSRPRWDFQDLRRVMYATLVDGHLTASAQSFPANRIKRLAHQLGYRDRRTSTGALSLVRDPNVDVPDLSSAPEGDEDTSVLDEPEDTTVPTYA